MAGNGESKLEKKIKIFYARDFLVPIVGWLAYASRSPYSNKTKEKIYGTAVNITQLGWVIGLSAWVINYGP